MEQALIYTTLILSGLILGSFAGATVWRLRARQLVSDKTDGDKVDNDELKRLSKLAKTSMGDDRSQCLYCDYRLKWYDMIPVISWLTLSGKCRSCHKSIGFMEPLIEVGLALFFVLSFMFWPFGLDSGLDVARFILWLLAGVGLAILFVYDLKWFILPDKVNFTVVGIGILYSLLVMVGAHDKIEALISIAISILILSGLYLALHVVSRGTWVGMGDVKLGLGLALLLADWRLAFIALFAANLIGCLIVLPGLMAGKLKRNAHIPFGPLLIAGMVIAGLAGISIIDAYFSVLL